MSAATVVVDAPGWHAHALVEKYTDDQVRWATTRLERAPVGLDFERLKLMPVEVAEADRNLITTAGLNRRASLLIGTGQAFTATAARLGVGNSTTAAAAGQTDLQASAGSTNRWFQVMDAGYPSVSGAVATFRATFGSSDANFTWNEWGLDVGTPTVTAGATVNALLLNRKVQNLGAKSGGSWVLTASITMS